MRFQLPQVEAAYAITGTHQSEPDSAACSNQTTVVDTFRATYENCDANLVYLENGEFGWRV